MAEPEVEAAWRAEFKRIHDTLSLGTGSNLLDRAERSSPEAA